MRNVLTLIAGPGDSLTAGHRQAAREALAAAGASIGATNFLSMRLAADIAFDDLEPDAAMAALAPVLAYERLDYFAQNHQNRRKKLLIADMDSTIITVECIDELADFAGFRDQVAELTERAMRGELDFSETLHARAALLAGLHVDDMQRAFNERVMLTPGARALVATMRRHGAYTALVSGGFTYFTRRVRELAGFDTDQANTLVIAEGRMTGEVVRPILDAGAKLMALKRFRSSFGLDPDHTLAVGDGANDIPMIQDAGLGAAYHGKAAVKVVADACINHGDLTSLLYLQGYRDDEIVSSV